MNQTIELILLFAFCGLIMAAVYWRGRADGLLLCAADRRCLERYRRAVDDLDRWCGHQSPQARLIAAHLSAVGEGRGLNAGTPAGDEPCTVNGLRQQLSRLSA